MIAGRWAEAPRCAVLPLHAVTAFEQTSARTLAALPLCRCGPPLCARSATTSEDLQTGWGPLLEQNDGLCSASLGAFAVCS